MSHITRTLVALFAGLALFTATAGAQVPRYRPKPLPVRPDRAPSPGLRPGQDWWRTYPWSPYNAWKNPYWYPPYNKNYPFPPDEASLYTRPIGPWYVDPPVVLVPPPAPSDAPPSPAAPAAPATDGVEVSGPLDAPPPHRGLIRLRLPATWTDVSIDGKKIDSMGKTRTYVTPELPQGRTFEVAATWKSNGRTHRVEDKVTVKAGQIRTLDFTSGR